MRLQDVLEKGTKAFISFIRAYKEHQCSFIFRCVCMIGTPTITLTSTQTEGQRTYVRTYASFPLVVAAQLWCCFTSNHVLRSPFGNMENLLHRFANRPHAHISVSRPVCRRACTPIPTYRLFICCLTDGWLRCVGMVKLVVLWTPCCPPPPPPSPFAFSLRLIIPSCFICLFFYTLSNLAG